jgi:hypothetical protein
MACSPDGTTCATVVFAGCDNVAPQLLQNFALVSTSAPHCVQCIKVPPSGCVETDSYKRIFPVSRYLRAALVQIVSVWT